MNACRSLKPSQDEAATRFFQFPYFSRDGKGLDGFGRLVKKLGLAVLADHIFTCWPSSPPRTDRNCKPRIPTRENTVPREAKALLQVPALLAPVSAPN